MISCKPCAESIAYQLQYLCCYVDISFPDFVLVMTLCVLYSVLSISLLLLWKCWIYFHFHFGFIAK